MVSAGSAIDTVTKALKPGWLGQTFLIESIFEDASSFAVSYGNAEYLTGNDPAAMLLNAPIALVDKQTGALSFLTYLGNESRIDTMTQVTYSL